MTDVFKKLNFKGQDPILVLAAPNAFGSELAAMGKETAVHRASKPGAAYGFVLAFAPMKADLLSAARTILKAAAGDAVLWFAYPKQTSKRYSSDINRDLCAAALKPLKLQPVRQIAMDDDWSALRFKITG
jgi:hypothetical protein